MSPAGTSYHLPFKGEKFTFGLSWKDGEESPLTVDLSCVSFDKDCKVLDWVTFNSPLALNTSVRHAEGKPDADGVAADELIYVRPQMVTTGQVMLFVASAAKSSVQRSDLKTCPKLEFSIHAKEYDGENKEIARVDLKPLVIDRKPEFTSALTNGHQSMVVCGAYLTEKGWQVSFDCSTFKYDNWGLILPNMKAIIKQWSGLLAAQNCGEIDANERITVTRNGEERSLLKSAIAKAKSKEGPIKKLRVDVGWALWKSAEEAEETSVEFKLAGYNLAGEEVAAIDAGAGEGDGFRVEEYVPPSAEGGDEAAAEGGDEEIINVEGDGAEEEAAKEAAAAAEPPLIPPNKFEFPLKFKVHLDLEALPKDLQSLLLVVSNYGGAGMKHVKTAQLRVLDVTEGEEAARPIFEYKFDSQPGADKEVSQVLVGKVYKEYDSSAFSAWAAENVKDVLGLISVGEELAAREANTRAILEKVLARKKATEVRYAELKKKAEEAGEELDEGADVRTYGWRYRCLGRCLGGASLAEQEVEVKNALSYEGVIDGEGRRSDSCAKATFPSKDTYFGAYKSDFKSGIGFYVFAAGAAYLGQYEEGKRSGRGYMIFPDGGYYRGCFEGDKFEGAGEYFYPDGSYYTGAWSKGKKHGAGTYWDATDGCLTGSWVKGVQKGAGSYTQPSYEFKGTFVKDIPAGDCTFTLTASRSADLRKAAAHHIIDAKGPTLKASSKYTIPAGSEFEAPEAVEGEEEAPPADDGDKPPIPAFPKYEGLGFISSPQLPTQFDAPAFPPKGVPLRPTNVTAA